MRKLVALCLGLIFLFTSVLAEEPIYDLEAILQLPAPEAVAAIADAKSSDLCRFKEVFDGGDIIEVNCEIDRLQLFYGLHYACKVFEDAFKHPGVPAVIMYFWEAESGMRPVHVRLTRETYESLDWIMVKDLIYDHMETFLSYMDGWSAMKDYKYILKY